MINDCGCNQNINPCGQPTCQETSCACEVYISSDCVNDVKADFNCLPIASHLDLTQTLEAMDAAICDKLEEQQSHFQIINIGSGSEVYKGNNLLGQKELRKINALGNLIQVTQNESDISVTIDETELVTAIQNLVNANNIGNGVEVYKDKINDILNFRTLKSTDDSIIITQATDEIDLSAKIALEEGNNITITGDGTTTSPYIVNSNFYLTTIVDQGISLTGAGTVTDPMIISLDSQPEIPWYKGDTKEVVCDSIYLNANFEASGLGKNQRLGWAIMNGATHGSTTVPNDNGKVVIAYGTDYPILEGVGGEKEHTLLVSELPKRDIRDTTVGATFTSDILNTSGAVTGTTPEPTPVSLMQPYVIRLRIIKL